MKRGVNKVILVGNLGNDPETKSTQAGGAVTSISVATSESWTDKQSGQKQERTEWHRVVFFNKLAEIASQYLRKGSKVYVEGKLATRKWQDQQGVDRYTTEIIGSDLQMLDSKDSGAQNHGYSPQPQQRSAQAPHPAHGRSSQPAGGHGQQSHQYQAPGFDDFDSEIPF